MAFDFSNISDEELEAMAAQSAPASGFGGAVPSAPQKPLSEWTDEELEAYIAEPTSDSVQPQQPRKLTQEERIAQYQRAIETARSQEEPGFLSAAGDALAEGAKGAARAVKDIGGGIVGMASGAVRLAGTPVRLATGWEGLHRLADTIDSSYENFGADALMSDYGENPDGFGFAAGRFGEKLAGTAGSLAALGGVGKAVGAAGTALKAAGHAKTAAAVANTLPLMFGNDAAVRAYDTARANGRSKTEAASLAGLNGAIHFLGFKAFENKALNKMLGMPAEMEGLMPKWAGEAAEAGGQSFSSLARGVRNGMIKYTLAERGKGALRAGGIMGLQNFLSDPVMQVAEGASIDDIDFSHALKAGAEGVGEGVLMEGALGAAAVLKSPAEARKFIADKIFRGKDYKVIGADGKPHDEPGLLNSSEGRMMLMKQNPDATERVLDIVEHGGTPRPAELDAAFLPPDMTAEELKKFASDWRNDLKPYVDEAWAADAPRQTAAPDPNLSDSPSRAGRDFLSPEEAQSQQKAANDAAERQKVADRRAAADSMMLDFESWNRLYADGKTDLNFDEWRAAGKPGVIEANLTPKTEEAPTSETRTNEEPAQPEQAEVVATATGAEARPVESAETRTEATDARVVAQPAVWPNGWDNAGEEIKGYVVPNDGDVAPGREVAIAHRSGGSINAPQKIKGVVESVDGDTVKVYYRDGMGYDQHDTFKKSELVGVMPLTAVPTEGATSQTAQNRAGVAQERAGARSAAETATTTPAPAKGVEGKESASAANGKPTIGKVEASIAGPQGYSMSGVITDPAHIAGVKKLDSEHDIVEVLSPPAVNNSGTMYVDVVERKNGKLFGGTYYVDTAGDMYHPVEHGLKGGTKDHLQEWLETRYTPQEREAKLREWEGKSAETPSRASGVENISPNLTEKPAETAKPVVEAPKTDASATAPAESGNAAPGISADDFVAAHSTTDDKGKRVANKDIDIQGEITPPPDYAAKKVKTVKPGDATAALKAVGRNASQDDTRIALKRVHVEGGQMVATDGRRIVVAPAPDGVADGNYDAIGAPIKPTESYVPYPANWRQVVPDVKRHGYRKIGEIANGDAAHGRIAFADETAGKVRRAKGGDLSVLLRVGNAGANPQFAKDVVNTMFALGAERLEVFQAPDFAPIVLKGRNAKGEITGVVMPLRIDGNYDVISEKQTQVKLFSDVANAVQTEGAKSASRASGAKSNRLRRADGTDPLAEKNPAPKTVRKAVDKISLAIANRTGTGVITPEEADGIVRGIVESPETKHNRYRDFFNPLESDAKWHESLGLDAESAKNVRDAVDRVKTDADLKKWFPQVDAAVKKANDGRLSKKDAVSLFGKISEGLEKAERMGLSEAANRLREAAEVIRPIAETITQGDVNKFNYSTKGQKLNNRLGGTDKRGGKTVSLDTKSGTVDVGSTGQGGSLDGNRRLIIDGVNGDELTVTMKDAAGKTLATRKMTRAQWAALANGADAVDGDPAAPQKGDLIRMSRNGESPAERNLRFASDENYQKWLKSRKANDAEPLRERYEQEQAKAAKSIARNTLPGVDVEVVDRAFNPETDGGNRQLLDGDGRVVGTFDRSTNKVKLYRGATAATLVHELGGHATLRFAEQEAERGNRQLLDRINRTIDEAPQALKDEIRSRYPGVDEAALRDEIWAALRERNSPAMEKAIKTLQGKAWYNRAWSAFRYAWKGLLARMGFNRADLSQIDKMSNDEFLSHLDRIMSDGKTLGRLEAMGEGPAPADTSTGSPTVREARSPRPAGSRIMDDQQTKGEKFTEKFIDSLAPVKSVQEELGGVKEVTRADGYTDHTKSTDLVAAKDKANGRLEHEVRQHQFRVDDINRDLARAALPKQSTEELVNDFNLYLQCKHAPERNLSVAQDRGDAYTPDYSEGMGQITLPGGNRIGLSENVANRLLKGMRGKYGLKFKMFENAADKVYKMLEADLDRRFDAGRLSAEDYAFYKTRWHGPGGADGKWAHYVPLKTDMERLEPEALNSSTAGMKRNEFMKAQGRGTGDIADSPLAAAVLQTEQGIRGSIKNEVANVEANLVEHAQKQGIPIAEIVPGDEIRRGRTYSFTFADGETVDASGSMRLVENHPEIHLFKRDGKLYAIRYDKGANGRGLAFAKAASGENMSRWGQGTEWIPHMTHWMSAMRTQYSPEFTVSNWLADHLEAAQALIGRYGLKEGGKAFAKTVASEIQNWKDLRAYLKDGTANGYIKEFVEGGGLTKGGVASEGFDAETQKIRSKIEQFRREQKQWREMSPADLAKSAGRHVADFLSFANELAEYSTRTGLYTALRKQGVPQAEAIKFARDATVNFNRKGTAMPYINGLYMFANASVQGAVRSVQAMRDTYGKELVAALTAIGVAKAVIDNYLGNDDEREAAGGRNARNQSEYDKKHNVGVPIGGGRQIVPLRFRGPYAAVPYLAQTAANVAMGVTSPEDGAKTLFRELGDQVTDLVGGNGVMNDKGEFDGALIGQSIAPSVADWLVQLATGKDYKGDERRRKSFDKTMPASSNGKRNTGDWYKVAAQTLNRISGGNEHRKGLVDVAPEDLQLVLEFLGGAPMRDLNNVASSVNNAVQLASGGTPERTLSQIPFVRRIVREYPESTSRYYDALEEYERDKAEFKKTTPERRKEMKADKPYLFVGKSLLDGQIEQVKKYMHLERGEVKVGQKWVEPKTPRTKEQKEVWRKKRLALQAQILERLGK